MSENTKTLIMKFGGASVSSPDKFLQIAKIIKARSNEYRQVVVVVSAMAGMTDYLLKLADQVHSSPPKREVDMLISVGERISISLLAMALEKEGLSAISFTGSQSGIITCAGHSEAKIVDVKPKRIFRELELGKVVIVAGFQGVSKNGEITTLGRGGSDTTAVALAVALDGDKVEFYKDVEGVYSADPKVVASAQKYCHMDYVQAKSLVSTGAKILHGRCIDLAMSNAIPLHVLSFVGFDSESIEGKGTMIESKTTRNSFEKKYEQQSSLSLC